MFNEISFCSVISKKCSKEEEMTQGHLLACEELKSIEDVTSKYWEARRRMTLLLNPERAHTQVHTYTQAHTHTHTHTHTHRGPFYILFSCEMAETRLKNN